MLKYHLFYKLDGKRLVESFETYCECNARFCWLKFNGATEFDFAIQ